MFHTIKFGMYLSRMRKNADMTQSELAEQLNITRQAISKYETGDSFPDISILVQIADIFHITMDELIRSGHPTEEDANIKKNPTTIGLDLDLNMNRIMDITPFIKPSTLGTLAEHLHQDGIDISQIVSLMQFLNDNDLLRLVDIFDNNALQEEFVMMIIPFLDASSKDVIIQKIINGNMDWRILKELLPFVEDMASQLEAAFIEGALPKEARDMINAYWLNRNRKQGGIK